ncbi:BnaC05g51310D [Brassica napus]|uniref:BnaC05g51310D protein n=1 Tax=Brassica napus TaxID=3708 RepID=A0A078IZX7_BRANA|nr:BnaC05g51310D [Brassica napus]
MMNSRLLFAVVLNLIIVLKVARAGAESKVHIVYLGEKQHDDPKHVTESHHQMLSSLLGSEVEADDSMVHSYRHGFSGFAAKLTESQAKKIADSPDVVHVIPDSFYKLATTRTWDYLGLSVGNLTNLLNDTNMGDQVIIGFIDSGVWPESESFNDNGVGPVPSHWKGGCQSGENFELTNCNRKLIGAKYFINGFLAENEGFNSTGSRDYISARDFIGHGTHVACIAGGSFVPNVSYKGLAGGNLRGGAPRARIAIYKACWYVDQLGTVACSSSDILKAMDEAMHDGVDVLSLSLGAQVPLIATGAFHAVAKGIIVVCAGGNSGPAAQTVLNTAPWVITVAATTLDRSFPTPITLGNNNVILGQALYTGQEVGFTSLVYPENSGHSNVTFSGVCERLNLNPNGTMRGKVVFSGTDILLYIRSTGSPVVKIQPSRTMVGQPVGTKVATFSSRGPNSISPAILKPDIGAPGVSILAATSPDSNSSAGGFDILAGTSMAAPVISGVVALLKAMHPDWSPAAFRSAIVTTAWRTDPFGEQIFAEGSSRKVADPFDYGGGLVNPEKAADPGLIYDMGPKDYIIYLCSAGYNDSSISQLVGQVTVCSNPKPSVLDVNLPSLTIPNLKEEVNLTRTVTNVGPVNSVYKVVVEPPLGVQVVVTPKKLVFNSKTKSLSFMVRVSTIHKINTGFYFGSLIWRDSVHNVTIPVHIVYLGEKQHDDPKHVTEYHHQMLSSLLGSKEDAHDSMVYSYRHGFSGFAARLTKSQAKKLADSPEVVHVMPDGYYELATTRTWDYLGLSAAHPKNLLNDTNMGDHVIIGVIDTGISRFHHMVYLSLECGQSLNHLVTMGLDQYQTDGKEAKYYINGFLAENDGFNSTKSPDYISARDFNGHGTHVASIAGGSYIPDVSYKGFAGGTLRGGAPRARIAMYKACWYLEELDGVTCSFSDIMKAMDDAIHDCVDVLSLSLGSRVPLFSETDMRDGIATGAFHAVAKGITVVCAGGNAGPSTQTVVNTAPWILTVAATTLDRSFATPITLGNNKLILGQAMYTGPELGFTSLVYPEDPGNSNDTFSGECESLNLNSNRTMAGKIVLCFTTTRGYTTVSRAASFVKRAGGLGLIIARNPGYTLNPCKDDFPCVAVDYELGTDILFYIRSNGSPVVKIQPSRTMVGQPVGSKVATFSSRGPNSISPAILKPDIAAPGVSILAATSPNATFNAGGFVMLSGTSMATPAISGVLALLKSLHPDWSPAAFRSAIVTTAWRTDPFGEQLPAEGSSRKVADPFDYGGGLVNPEKAAEPGLIYDMGPKDYILYLCSVVCTDQKPSVLDMNLPSITIPNLKDEVILTRTVTNVGPVHSVYKVVVEPPLGVRVVVTPKKLVFNSKTKSVSFTVRVSTTHKINTGYYFGSLIWSDSVRKVTIPVSVRTQILQNYYDEN